MYGFHLSNSLVDWGGNYAGRGDILLFSEESQR